MAGDFRGRLCPGPGGEKLIDELVLRQLICERIRRLESCADVDSNAGDWSALSGGSINQCYRLQLAGHHYFVKLSRARQGLAMFTAEAAALTELSASSLMHIPSVLVCDEVAGSAFLVLEYITLRPLLEETGERFGYALASLHRQGAEYFGWAMDNTIGLTAQDNSRHQEWPTFFAVCRLQPQFMLALERGASLAFGQMSEQLLARLPCILGDHKPLPSLLHGDLWSGNVATDEEGRPVLFDPASYYGDREVDLAMSELFAGFPASFYRGYHACWPLSESYPQRRQLYNLYHIVNHYNLFGGHYLRQAEAMMRDLLHCS